MKTIDEVLYELLLFNALERKALLLSPNRTNPQIYRAITDAIKKKYVREKTSIYYRERKRFQYSFLTLTSAGIRYILSNEEMLDEYEWLNFILFKSGRIAILNVIDSNYSTKKSMQKYISLTTSAMLAKRCGADVHPMYLDLLDYDSLNVVPTEEGFKWTTDSMSEDDYEEEDDSEEETDLEEEVGEEDANDSENSSDSSKKTPAKIKRKPAANPLSKIVISAYKADREYGSGRGTRSKNQLIYLNAIEVKHIAINSLYLSLINNKNGNTEETMSAVADVRRGRFSGIMQSQEKLLMMYVEPSYGMKWSKRFFKADKDALSQYIKHLKSKGTLTINGNFIEGCLLVRNAEEFAKNFCERLIKVEEKFEDPEATDKKGKKKKPEKEIPEKEKNPENELGHGFDRFYLIPINMDGVNQLKWLSTLDVQGYESQMLDWCTRSVEEGGGGYVHLKVRVEGAGSALRLSDPSDGIPVFQGELMDIGKMYSIKAAYEINPDLKVKVLCYPWQEEYYKAIFPNIITVANE